MSCCYVITALHDILNSKLTIIRLFTSVTNPYMYLPNIIFLGLCFELFLNLRSKIEKILYYTRFISHFNALISFIALVAALLVL
jgi:hypothetical protein